MADIEHLKKFQESYEHSFVLDWIENLSWRNLRDAFNSCDEGRRRINKFKRESFINISKSTI